MKKTILGVFLISVLISGLGCVKGENAEPCTNKSPESEQAAMVAYASAQGFSMTLISTLIRNTPKIVFFHECFNWIKKYVCLTGFKLITLHFGIKTHSFSRATSSRYRCSLISHLCLTLNMITKATMSSAATINTSIRDASFFCVASFLTMSARLYHPEKKLAKMAITSNIPSGRPSDNCRKIFLRRRRFSRQKSTNPLSSGVSIIRQK